MEDKIEKLLNDQESAELLEGQRLYEMTKTPGFEVLRKKLEEAAFHSWVDPREIDGAEAKKEWEWRELNAFHAANNARELLEWIQATISRSEYLEKKKKGDVSIGTLKF